MRPDGSKNHRILEGDAEYPAWSPDGEHLAFMSLGSREGLSSDDYDIYVVDADGRNMQQLTRSPGEDGWPAWSHDGTRIAYSHMDAAGAEIHVMAADGQDDRVVTDPGDGLAHDYPSWSPDDALHRLFGLSTGRVVNGHRRHVHDPSRRIQRAPDHAGRGRSRLETRTLKILSLPRTDGSTAITGGHRFGASGSDRRASIDSARRAPVTPT